MGPNARTHPLRRRLAASALGLTFAAAGVAGAQNFDDDVRDSPKITIYLLSSSAEKELDFALTLLTQGRFADAVAKLRPFTTKYGNRCVGVEVQKDGSVKLSKESGVWYGVGHFLAKHVDSLHPDVKAELERIDGTTAKGQLAAAVDGQDLDGILKVASQYPWTKAGAAAIVAAASLARERGALDESLALYRRAAERAELAADPNVQAAIVLLSRALGGRGVNPVPTEEPADVAGKAVQVRGLETAPLPAVPPGPVHGGFATPNEGLPLDPGAVNGGYRAEGALRAEVPMPIEPRPIIPVIAGDTVYATNGWSLSAFELSTGRPKKAWPEFVTAQGLTGLSRGERESYVEGEDKWIPLAPAVSGNVVVTPLIVPLKVHEKFVYATYNQIRVRIPIPYRKLHAFDTRTGAPLWDHWRPEIAKQQNDFLDQYRCASSATIQGSRVLAPLYRVVDGATVEFHLTAFDLKTGAVVWDTNLLTGSVPINMFGRSLDEFYCCPVTVEGDRAYVSTDLGAAACLDALTGQVLWVHRYDAIPFPRADYHSRSSRPVYWTASPPAYDDEVVVFTPTDSSLLLAVDKRSGRRVARHSIDRQLFDASDSGQIFAATPHYVRHNLGIAGGVLYVAGEQVYALDVPSASSPSFRRRAVSSLRGNPLTGARPARPALTDKSVLVPASDRGIAVVDRQDLRLVHTIPYDVKGMTTYPGNLAVGDGIVVSAANPRLGWFFDTNALVETARRAVAENPNDPQLRDRLAESLRLRGANLFEERSLDEAIDSFREAERVLATAAKREGSAAKIGLALADALAARGDVKDAIHEYRRALDGAADGDTRLRAAIGLERQLPREARADRAKVLDLLDKEFVSTRLVNDELYGDVLVGLYTCLRRADVEQVLDGGPSVKPGDPAIAVAAWQDCIVRFPEETFGAERVNAAAHARTKIAEAIRRHGRACYQAVEDLAVRELASLGANPAPADLSRLIRTYPNSQVAMNAACLRVEQMAKGSQVIDVPMAVHEFLQNDPPAELRARALQANAAVLRRLGNETAAAALDARALGKPAAAAPAPRGPAGPDVNITTELYEDAAPLLRWIRPDIDDRSAGEMAFALDRSNLLAFRSVTASRSKRFWRLSLPREVVSSETGTQTAVKFPAISIQNGVLTCVHADYLIGVRADSGAAVFTYQLDGDVESSTAAGGVLLLTERSAEPGTPVRLAAYDAVGGAPLWQADLDARGGPYVLVASETDTLALGLGAREPRVKLRFDTLTGDVKSAVPSAASLDKQLADLSQWRRDYESASQKRGDRGGQFRDLAITDRMREFREWFSLYNGVLVYFVKHQADAYQSRIVGLHLGDGSGGDAPKTWELAASKTPKTRLGNVLFAPNDVLVLRQSGDGGTTQDKMEVLRLDPATGEATQVALVPFGAQLAGAEWDTPLRWNQPGLLTFTAESGAASTRLDFVDLQNRRAWSRSIPIRLSLVERPPMPAIGNNVIGIAYSTTPARSSGTTPSQHELRLLRRDTGDYAADLAFPLNDGKPLGFVLTDSSFFAMSGQPLYRASIRRFFGSESNR